MNRLAICLKHGAALGLDVDLQATEKAAALLGRQRHKSQNVPALNWREVPAFYASLADGTVTHLALRLLILTGVRSGPLRFMTEAQIDGNVWTIPGESMKGRKDATSDYRVPLSIALQLIVSRSTKRGRSLKVDRGDIAFRVCAKRHSFLKIDKRLVLHLTKIKRWTAGWMHKQENL